MRGGISSLMLGWSMCLLGSELSAGNCWPVGLWARWTVLAPFFLRVAWALRSVRVVTSLPFSGHWAGFVVRHSGEWEPFRLALYRGCSRTLAPTFRAGSRASVRQPVFQPHTTVGEIDPN